MTALAQRVTLDAAADAAHAGITIVDLRQNEILHHGKLSSALTNLHKAGRLVRLQERRDRSHVYVLPEYAGERETAPFKPNRPQIDREDLRATLGEHHVTISMTPGRPNHCTCHQWAWTAGHDFLDHLADVIVAEFGR